MDLDLRRLFRIARRWWWLLLLAPALAGATAYAVSDRQQPIYSATATLRITPGQGSTANDDFNAIRASQSLGETYRLLILTSPVLDRVVTAAELPYDADALRDKVSSSAVRDTQLVRVSVRDPDPVAAAQIANTIATEFAAYVAQQAVDQISTTRSGLDAQTNDLEAQLAELDRQILDLEQAPALAPADQQRLDTLRVDRSRLQQDVTDLQMTARSINVSLAAAQTQVAVANPAAAPEDPVSPKTTQMTMLGLVAGLLVAAGGVALLEYLDNTVKAGMDFVESFGTPSLATVTRLPKLREGHDQLFTIERPRSPAAEAIRLLRANVEFAVAAEPITTLAISSAGPREGKSTITANLGVAMAQAGFSTLIIDADLRRPTQHRIFDVSNDRGLTTLLTHPDQPWRWAAVQLGMPELAVMPSGPIPPSPADLLRSDRFEELVTKLRGEVDVILIDTAPVLAVSDPLLVAKRSDAIMLVCHSGQTRIEAFRRTISTVGQAGIRLVGVVVNQQTGRASEGYYYAGYYGQDDRSPVHQDGAAPAAIIGSRQ